MKKNSFEYFSQISIFIISLTLILALIYTNIRLDTYNKETIARFNQIYRTKECSDILYLYPGDKHPVIMKNNNLNTNIFMIPRLMSKFCTYDQEKCIVDFEEDAYDEFCIRWTYAEYSNLDDISFYNEYVQKVIFPLMSGVPKESAEKNMDWNKYFPR